MYNLLLHKNVKKFLVKCDINIVKKFDEQTKILLQNPYKNNLDIRKLKGYENKYGLRISKYRFLYEIVNDKILIYFYKTDSRGDVY